MTTEEVAKKVVELVRKQAWYEALDTLYDNDIVSVEATAPDSRGKEAVRGKFDWWVNAMQVHTFKASEPFVAHDRFVVQYDADVTEKEATKNVRGWRLDGEGREDRARRISAARGRLIGALRPR